MTDEDAQPSPPSDADGLPGQPGSAFAEERIAGSDAVSAAAGTVTVHEPLCAVFRRHLKSLGHKYTPERARVLDALIELDDVFVIDDVQHRLAGAEPRVSKATVYRTMRLLLDAGIVQQVPLAGESTRYQLAYGRRPRDLIIRVDTDEIIPVDVPELIELRDRICRRLGVAATGHRFQIFATGG